MAEITKSAYCPYLTQKDQVRFWQLQRNRLICAYLAIMKKYGTPYKLCKSSA